MSDFLNMGGYAVYVWPAYGLSFLGIGGLALYTWRRGRTLRAYLRKLETLRSGERMGKPPGRPL